MEEMNNELKRFYWVTQALAHSCEEQKSLFTDFSNVADELAIEWEQALEELMNSSFRLTKDQELRIKVLDDYMSSISGPENIQYWNNEALCTSSQWERMRQMADDILGTMGWEKKLPEPEKVTVVYIDNATRLRVHFEKALKKIKKIFS